MSCLAATPYHVLTGSEDSNIHVWSLARLLERDAASEMEPDVTLSNHRGPITALAVNESASPETSICVSASKDKTCILWNYQTGEALRTLLFPSVPLCVAIDPASRAIFVSTEDGSLYLIELFGDKPLIGRHSVELASTVVQVTSPLGASDPDGGPASCLALSHDGTTVLTGHTKGKIMQWQLTDNGHPTELTNLNASITNLVFTPLLQGPPHTKPATIVKPSLGEPRYIFTSQLETDLGTESRFDTMLHSAGFPSDLLDAAVLSFTEPPPQAAAEGGGQEAQKHTTEELWQIINEQRALQKATMQKLAEAKSGSS